MKRAFSRLWVAVGVAWLLVAPGAGAEPLVVERAIARFWAPDTGGVRSPHFVYERVLAFEARLEALSDSSSDENEPFRDRHLTAALERHVAETLLSSLHIDPEPTEAELGRQIQAARARLVERVGGEEALARAAQAEGMGTRDVLEVVRRQARASLYLDRMVAPMLDPSTAELRTLHRTRHNPFRDLPFERVEPGLRRWYVAQRLAAAVQGFYQNARSRITLTLLD
ncbi:MAG: hypothetical protein QM756_32955 [Polyangiaceae bacterium]